jgi:hypothetical protein
LVLIPPAFAVFGGVHIHLAQIVIALPTFAYICMRYPIVRNVTGVGMTFTMIPWNVLSASVMTGFTPFLVGIFGRAMLGARRGLILTLVAAAIALSVLVLAVKGLETPTVTFVGKAYPPNALAEASWAPFSHAVLGHYSVLMQLLRIPTLVGLALGLTGTVMAAFGRASVGARQPTGSVIYGANRTL